MGGMSVKVVIARIRWGYLTRTWPWKIPREVVLIGTKRPPEHVFEFFRRLHGITDANDSGEVKK